MKIHYLILLSLGWILASCGSTITEDSSSISSPLPPPLTLEDPPVGDTSETDGYLTEDELSDEQKIVDEIDAWVKNLSPKYQEKWQRSKEKRGLD